MIGTTVGHYRIESLLGEGGMGTVYRAFDTTLRRPAALKVLGPYVTANDEALRRFIGEARSASRLNHPNVVTIYEVGSLETEGHFIAMELVEGETLRSILERGPAGVQQTAEWIAQLADGLATAHAAGIIHRDLKPENVVIAESGFVKILDFGLAKLRAGPELHDADGRTSTIVKTTPGIVLGTVGYMSPEQARGQELDHRTDIFSTGCILYECLTAREPFAGDGALDTMHRIIYSEPAPIEELAPGAPPELVRITRKCLAKDPAERYQSAKDLAVDLRTLQRQPPPTAHRALPAVIFAAVTIALLAIATVLVLTRTKPPAKPMSITRVTSLGNVIGAAISPDGEYAAYAYSENGLHSLWVRQMATGSTVQIVAPARLQLAGGKFAPDGRSFFYTARDTLYQIPVLGGTPRKLLTNISGAVSFSPDGKRIAFQRVDSPRHGDSAIVIANADGSGQRVLIAKSPPETIGTYPGNAPEWSPDGESIATALRTPSGMKVILADAASGATRTVSQDFTAIGSMAWLRDGSGIVTVLNEHAASAAQLWLINPGDGTRRAITNDLVDYRTVTATRDGRVLAVAADTLAHIWRIGADGAAQKITSGRSDGNGGLAVANDGTPVYATLEEGKWQLWRGDRHATGIDVSGVAPAISRDGRLIVFTMLRERDAVLARMNADGTDVRVLCPIVAERYPQPAAITPDGRAVIFGSDGRLWKVSIDGGRPVRITGFDAMGPAISPDGTRIAFILRTDFTIGDAIGVLPLEGGPVARFPAVALHSFSCVRWTADGTGLLHNAGVNDRVNLWLQPLDGTPPRRITNLDDDYLLRFDVSPDGKHLMAVRGVLSRDAVLIENFR
jgi:Tol biopolymer transport system component